MSETCLGIIAGDGELPQILANYCKDKKRPYFIVTFKNLKMDWVREHPHYIALYEKPRDMFLAMHKAHVKEVVFAGAMQRPRLNPLKFDSMFLRFSARLLPAIKSGDNKTLQHIATLFESQGFLIVSAHSIIDIMPSQSMVHTKRQPLEQDIKDAQRGFAIINAMAGVDIGQGCVVADGLCLGVETIQGTNDMLSFVGHTNEDYRVFDRGLLIKGMKITQDQRMDMPTIGLTTLQAVSKARLSGIVIETGKTQVIDLPACIDYANAHNLLLWSVIPKEIQ